MRTALNRTKRPVKSTVRRYPTEQRKCLNKYVEKLVEMGFLIPNPNTQWQSTPHLVPKQSKAHYRTTIDLRSVNTSTESQAWPMQNLEAEMQDFEGHECFASIDFVSVYWQLPLHPHSYEACGAICPNGVYYSTRVLHGLRNSAAHFQSSVEPSFAQLRSNIKAWIYDFNINAGMEEELLEVIERFIEIAVQHNLFISVKKSTFFATSIKWCGRIIDKGGYRMDPSTAEGIRNMEEHKTADELCQFVHCARWMSSSIPNFARTCEPLNEILEKAYVRAWKRKKRAIKNIRLADFGWEEEQSKAFRKIQDSITNAIKLSFAKKGWTICVYTDASKIFWSRVITQTHPETLTRERSEKVHELLAFIDAEFSKTEKSWTTFEKEGFSIFRVFDKLDYLLMGEQKVHVFTDHRNLLYVFAPTVFHYSIGRHTLAKVQRWAIFFSQFEFFIEHIDGSDNVFEDILTRWKRGHRIKLLRTNQVSAVTVCGSGKHRATGQRTK